MRFYTVTVDFYLKAVWRVMEFSYLDTLDMTKKCVSRFTELIGRKHVIRLSNLVLMRNGGADTYEEGDYRLVLQLEGEGLSTELVEDTMFRCFDDERAIGDQTVAEYMYVECSAEET